MYASKYGADRPLTAAQKLAELICERIADHEQAHLGLRFWQETRWKSAFARQVQAANRLLKLYDFDAVVASLNALPRVRSLGATWLVERIEQEQAVIDANRSRAERAAPVVSSSPDQGPRQGVKKASSVKSKLKGL